MGSGNEKGRGGWGRDGERNREGQRFILEERERERVSSPGQNVYSVVNESELGEEKDAQLGFWRGLSNDSGQFCFSSNQMKSGAPLHR